MQLIKKQINEWVDYRKMNSLKETPTNLKRKVVNEYFEKGKTSGKFSSVKNLQ